jgi:hypothetical protein
MSAPEEAGIAPKQPTDDEGWDAEGRFWLALQKAAGLPDTYEWDEATAALDSLIKEREEGRGRLIRDYERRMAKVEAERDRLIQENEELSEMTGFLIARSDRLPPVVKRRGLLRRIVDEKVALWIRIPR